MTSHHGRDNQMQFWLVGAQHHASGWLHHSRIAASAAYNRRLVIQLALEEIQLALF